MKTTITWKESLFVGFILILLSLGAAESSAQTSHSVDVSGTSFTPSTLTINVGDTVIWTNTGGTHNVNGTTATYPSNPESFGNDIGTGWTYPHIFKIKGTYDYRCDLHYSLGMVGKIIVNSTATGFAANKVRGEDVLLYPNPATAKVHVWVKGMNAAPTTIAFYNALGSKIQIQPYSTNSDQIDFDIQNFKQGLYLLKVKNQQVEKVIKFVKQ